jgi:hypothetical protein
MLPFDALMEWSWETEKPGISKYCGLRQVIQPGEKTISYSLIDTFVTSGLRTKALIF